MPTPTEAEINDLLRSLPMVRFAGSQRLYHLEAVRQLLRRLPRELSDTRIDELLGSINTVRRQAKTALMVRDSDLRALLTEVLDKG